MDVDTIQFLINENILFFDWKEKFENFEKKNYYCNSLQKMIFKKDIYKLIITFNYDCFLDNFLKVHRKDFYENVDIEHIHGKINLKDNTFNDKEAFPINKGIYKDWNSKKAIHEPYTNLTYLSETIGVYFSGNDLFYLEKLSGGVPRDRNKIDKIIFIGFGFDKQNLKHIGLWNNKENKLYIFANTKIVIIDPKYKKPDKYDKMDTLFKYLNIYNDDTFKIQFKFIGECTEDLTSEQWSEINNN